MPVICLIETGRNISALRVQRNMSVRELQEAFGFATPQAIYKWQQGASLPTIDNLAMLSYIFSVSIDEILVIEIAE